MGILYDGPEGPCPRAFQIYSTSRVVAGGPVTGDGFKRELQSLEDAAAAGVHSEVEFSAEEWSRRGQIFSDGVCDYTKGDARRP